MTIYSLCFDCSKSTDYGRTRCQECAAARERKRSTTGKAAARTRGHKGVELRAAIRRRYGFRCAVLDPTRCTEVVALEVHHLNSDPGDDRPENLVCVCREHHRQITAGATFEFAEPTGEPFIGIGGS